MCAGSDIIYGLELCRKLQWRLMHVFPMREPFV